MDKLQTIPLIGIAGTGLNGYSVKENLSNSDIQVDTLVKVFEKYGPDGLFTFMDLTVEAEALGLEIRFPEDDTPSVLEHPVKDRKALEKIRQNYNGISGRMPVFIEVVKKLRARLDTEIGAYVIGPFSLAGELNGVNDLLMNTMLDPEFADEMVKFSVELISEYANALFDAGADSVCILEPTAMMLTGDLYEKFSLEAFRQIGQNTGNRPLILHICGDTNHLVEQMGQSGAVALSLDSMVDFKAAAERIPSKMKLIGNIDPVEVFLNGNREHVCTSTRHLMKEMKDFPNFILSSGCDLPLDTPPENIEAFMETGKS